MHGDPPYPHQTWAEFYCSLPANPHQKINNRPPTLAEVARRDPDLAGDMMREERQDAYVRMGEKERYGS